MGAAIVENDVHNIPQATLNCPLITAVATYLHKDLSSFTLGSYDREDRGEKNRNPLITGLCKFGVADELAGQAVGFYRLGQYEKAYSLAANSGYWYGKFTLSMGDFAPFAAMPIGATKESSLFENLMETISSIPRRASGARLTLFMASRGSSFKMRRRTAP